LLPSAHAVLFILAADTGVTQTDLAIWRDHIGAGSGRMVVLNKIDGLWDGIRPDAEIDAEIERQVRSCAQILECQANSLYPVSAQKGLVAKVNGDPALLEKSRLPQLEEALAEELLPAKQNIVARGTAIDAQHLAGEVRQLLATRVAAIGAQLTELTDLRGKNDQVVALMVAKVKAEKETHERSLREYYAVRSVFSQLSETLFSHLGMENLRTQARRTRELMRNARFSPQLTSAMGELFAVARENLAASTVSIDEVAAMMRAMYEKFGRAYGVALEQPETLSLGAQRQQLDELERSFRRQFGSVLSLLTRDKRTLTQQFFDTIASQLRKIFDHANREADYWLRSLMAPLENQVREVQRQMKHRLESVRRIHEAAESLEERIEELQHGRAVLEARLNELEELQAGLEAALRPPRRATLRVAA
jgi:hypothetical protein